MCGPLTYMFYPRDGEEQSVKRHFAAQSEACGLNIVAA